MRRTQPPMSNLIFAMLTQSNLHDRLRSIVFECLTKVMQDATVVTRKLGVSYLNIDAHCIIQDSHSDRTKEAGAMANIYRNAYMTIAAEIFDNHADEFFAQTRMQG